MLRRVRSGVVQVEEEEVQDGWQENDGECGQILVQARVLRRRPGAEALAKNERCWIDCGRSWEHCATLMVVELSFKELGQRGNVVHLCFLDVLHATKNILAGLLKLGLVHANLFFDTEIVTAGLLQLVCAGIVGEASVLELLASVLAPLEVVQPSRIGAVNVRVLDTSNALVGTTQRQETVSELGILLKVLTVSSHGSAKSRHWGAALLVLH
ncbi:hypothetical protein HG531_009969 [Fusarium graminearum]|nr:hypothetical protein HG531_009969 [Fusarium graminearum]